MLDAKKILKEIKEFNSIKIRDTDNYDFKNSDNAYLINKGSVLIFGENNSTLTFGELDPIGFAEVILARTKHLKYKITSDLDIFSF